MAPSGKGRLMSAAHALFGKGSFAEVSVGSLLKLSRVQAPTLYHHFGDKEGLYVAWALDVLGSVSTTVDNELASAPAPHALQAYAHALLTCGSNIGQILHDSQRMSRSESGEQIMGAYFERIFEPLCGLLVQMAAEGEIVAEPVDRLAQLFITLASTSALEGGGDSSQGAAWTVERFLHGVSA